MGAGADGTDAVISVVEAALSFKSRSNWPIFALPSSIPVLILKHIRSIFFIEEKTYIHFRFLNMADVISEISDNIA